MIFNQIKIFLKMLSHQVLKTWRDFSNHEILYFIILTSFHSLPPSCSVPQDSDRIDSFWFAKSNKKRFWFARWIKFFFDLWFTWANHFISDFESFWFTFEANESHWFILIRDSIWFYSFSFGLILIRRDHDSSCES